MKALLIMLFMAVAVMGNAQRGIVTHPVDTLKGNNNQVLATIGTSGSNSAVFEITCNKVSSAAGGTLYIKGGLSDSIVLNESNSNLKFSTNDTLTITDGLVWRVAMDKAVDYKYYVYGDGDANDTVKITTKVLLKR